MIDVGIIIDIVLYSYHIIPPLPSTIMITAAPTTEAEPAIITTIKLNYLTPADNKGRPIEWCHDKLQEPNGPIHAVVPGHNNAVISWRGLPVHTSRPICFTFFRRANVRSTVKDGNSPDGSTELDYASGYNYPQLRKPKIFKALMILVLGATEHGYATYPRTACYVNYLLNQISTAINLHASINLAITGDKKELGITLATLTILLIGRDSMTYEIFDDSFGQDTHTKTTLGGKYGHTEHIVRGLRALHKIARNHLYCWTNSDALPGNQRILTDEYITNAPPLLRTILEDCKNESIIVHTREPIDKGTKYANIILDNLRAWAHNPDSTSTFHLKAVEWYTDFLVNRENATDATGDDNGIFVAWGIKCNAD